MEENAIKRDCALSMTRNVPATPLNCCGNRGNRKSKRLARTCSSDGKELWMQIAAIERQLSSMAMVMLTGSKNALLAPKDSNAT